MYKYRFVLLVLVMTTSFLHAQKTGKKWSFYGGFGLNISTDYTYIGLQPGAIYHLHSKFKLGAGIQYTYLKSNKNYYGVNYSYHIYGFNTLALFYPLNKMEISGEFEDLYIKQRYNDVQRNYWSPALFAGLAYRYGAVAFGFKFNFLYDNDKSIYQDALIPFVRIYF